jgi:hypothetical protein
MASAAGMLRSSGLISTYMAHRAKSPVHISAAQFFGPFEENLLTLLKDRGVSLYNDELDALRLDQRVIDEVLALQDSQQIHRPTGAKPYDANLHDMVLWHFVRDRLPLRSDSPLDGRSWVVSIDFGLINFDRRKKGGSLPIVVSPSDLVQLLAFFVPRSDEYDRTWVESLREPLIFMDFDADDEAATLAILSNLSRYDNSEVFSTDTVRSVLMNTALRTSLRSSHELKPEQKAELIRDAIVKTAEERLRALEGEREENKSLRTSVEALTSRLAEVERLESERSQMKGIEELPFATNLNLPTPVETSENPTPPPKGRSAVFLVMGLAGVAVVLSAILVDPRLADNLDDVRLRLLAYVLVLVAAVAGVLDWLAPLAGMTRSAVRRVARWTWRAILGVVVSGILIGIVGNAYYDAIKNGAENEKRKTTAPSSEQP